MIKAQEPPELPPMVALPSGSLVSSAFPVNADVEAPNLDLSPDGTSIAFISLNMFAGRIRISQLDASQRDVDAKGIGTASITSTGLPTAKAGMFPVN